MGGFLEIGLRVGQLISANPDTTNLAALTDGGDPRTVAALNAWLLWQLANNSAVISAIEAIAAGSVAFSAGYVPSIPTTSGPLVVAADADITVPIDTPQALPDLTVSDAMPGGWIAGVLILQGDLFFGGGPGAFVGCTTYVNEDGAGYADLFPGGGGAGRDPMLFNGTLTGDFPSPNFNQSFIYQSAFVFVGGSKVLEVAFGNDAVADIGIKKGSNVSAYWLRLL